MAFLCRNMSSGVHEEISYDAEQKCMSPSRKRTSSSVESTDSHEDSANISKIQLDQMEAMEIQMKRRLLDLKKRYQQKQHELNKLQRKNLHRKRCTKQSTSLVKKEIVNTEEAPDKLPMPLSPKLEILGVEEHEKKTNNNLNNIDRVPSPSYEDDPHSFGSKKRKHTKPKKVNQQASEMSTQPPMESNENANDRLSFSAKSCVQLKMEDLVDGVEILMYQEGNVFSAGTLTQIHPPDLYGVLLKGDRHRNRPIVLCQEEVIDKCILEKTVSKNPKVNTRIAAYWSRKMHCLYPGNIVTENDNGQVQVDFDDGDSALIPLSQIRLLPEKFAPLSRQNGNARPSNKSPDGLSKIEKTNSHLNHHEKSLCGHETNHWQWFGTSCQSDEHNGVTKKVFYKAITKEKVVISCGDCAVFLSSGRPNLPYIGLIESMWESWAKTMVVRVRWFYHPEEMQLRKGKYPIKNALYKSTHIDENDVQTISHICFVLSYEEYKRRRKIDETHRYYYCAGTYDPSSGLVTENFLESNEIHL